MLKKLLKVIVSAAMVLSLTMVSTLADEEEETTTFSTEEFLADLEDDGYAELDAWKVEAIAGKDNVYHMDESTTALPGGAYDEDGNMNNPSSIYFVISDDEVLIVDGGNPMEVGSTKEAAAKTIVDALTAGKETSIAFTHNHGDHMGLAYNEAVLADVNVKTVYVNTADDSDYLGAAIEKYNRVHVGEGEDEVHEFTVGGRTYEAVDIHAHTAGSMAYVDVENEIVFTGDSIGSGFVWIFWQEGTNPLGTLSDGITKLQGYVGQMTSPKILCGHRWQQFWENNEQRPGEMTIQYLNDMAAVLTGLTNGSTLKSEYTSYGTDSLELSANGCKAKIDTTPALIQEYLDGVNSYNGATDVWVFSAADTLSIETVNAVNAAKFLIFPDTVVSKEEAQQLIDDMGISDIIAQSASMAVVMSPRADNSYDENDVEIAMDIIANKIGATTNLNLIGIGNGATFINEYMSQKDWGVAGIMTYGGEAGQTPAYSVPAYVSNSDDAVAADYIKANNAVQTSTEGTITIYANPDNAFEEVAVNSAEEDVNAAFQNAWKYILSKYGRIGNIVVEGASVGTWYWNNNTQEKTYMLFESVDAINDQFERIIVTKDFDGDGIDSLYYVYIPETVKDAEDGTVPVVFLMHGNTNDPRTQYDTSGWAQVALEEGIILVCPEWQGHTYQGYTYDPMTDDSNSTPNSDFTTCVKDVLADYPQIDASRVYISGLSAGCMNTTNNSLVNTSLFAAGAGQSGPFKTSGTTYENLQAGVEANKDAYDIPIIYFAGDADEYLTDWDQLTGSGGEQIALLFAEMNEIELSTGNEEYSKLYGIAWDEYTEDLANDGLCTIISGTVRNAKGVEICMNRILGWGHWNYAPDAKIMWEFMSKYSRDQETGEIIIAGNEVTPTDPEVDPGTTPGTDETPETPDGGETSGTVTPNTGVYNNAAYVAVASLALAGAAYVAMKKKKED